MRWLCGGVWAAVLAGVMIVSTTSRAIAAQAEAPVEAAVTADFLLEPASVDTRYAADWVVRHADNQGRPFAVVDKRDARLYIFAADGRLVGASPVLLGLAPGDEPAADIARREPSSLAPGERTTPAGRYRSEPGHNLKGEDIVWFDYDASLAIHRLRAAPAGEHRRERLASASPGVKRISFGCVVVPVAFYEAIVAPSLGRQRGVVYVLPETRPVHDMFGRLQASLGAR